MSSSTSPIHGFSASHDFPPDRTRPPAVMASGIMAPPEGMDLTADRRPTLIVLSAVLSTLSIACVAMRIISRMIKGLRLWLDDWLIIVAEFGCLGAVWVVNGYSTSHGVGRHVWAAPPDATYAFEIALFSAEILYTLHMTCTKLSILSFYWRTFNVWTSIRIPIWTLAGIVVTWGIAVLSATIVQCTPVYALWERFNPQKPLAPSEYTCGVVPRDFFYGNAVPNIITDILLMLLPLPYIWRLHLDVLGKIAFSLMFLLGIFVTGVSIVRLVILLHADLQSPDAIWNFVDFIIWTTVELNVCIICACLPFIKPVSDKIFRVLPVLRSLTLSYRKSNGSRGKEARSGQSSDTSGVEKSGKSGDRRQSQKYAEVDTRPFANLENNESDGALTARHADSIELEHRSLPS